MSTIQNSASEVRLFKTTQDFALWLIEHAKPELFKPVLNAFEHWFARQDAMGFHGTVIELRDQPMHRNGAITQEWVADAKSAEARDGLRFCMMQSIFSKDAAKVLGTALITYTVDGKVITTGRLSPLTWLDV